MSFNVSFIEDENIPRKYLKSNRFIVIDVLLFLCFHFVSFHRKFIWSVSSYIFHFFFYLRNCAEFTVVGQSFRKIYTNSIWPMCVRVQAKWPECGVVIVHAVHFVVVRAIGFTNLLRIPDCYFCAPKTWPREKVYWPAL